MARYIVRRLLQAIPLLIGISLLTFLLLQLTPGGPLAAYSHAKISPEVREAIKHKMGLDQPLYIQYFKWLFSMVKGEWGRSFTSTRPVLTEVAQRLPNTLLLMGASFLLTLFLAIPLGIISARRKYTFFDHFTTFLSFFGMSMPVFWFGLMLILLFSVTLKWLPLSGMATLGEPFSLIDRFKHLIMPALVLSITMIASYSRFMRSSMIEVLESDYIRTARAKGLPERAVIYKHGLKNGLIPVVTVVTLDLPYLFSGAIITETIFGWPGMGRLYFGAVLARNYPILMAIIMLTAILVILANILADVLYAWLNPRVRYREER